MEQIRNYIESGLLQLYVLGLSPDEEVSEIEKLAGDYPEIREAIADIELQLQNDHMELAKEPPYIVKAELMAAIEFE